MPNGEAPNPTSEFTPELVGRIRRLPQVQQDSIVRDYVTKYYPQVQKWPQPQRDKLFQDFGHKYIGAGASASGGVERGAAPSGVPSAEQEALQTPGESVIGQIQKHPYITAAAIGAATPPGWAAELGAGLGAGIGALEQVGYQGLAALAGKVGGPYAALATGILAPLTIPRAASFMTGVPGALETGASTAASAQEEANLAERTKAAKSVAAEADSNRKAIQAAYEKQGSSNLKELKEAHEKAAQRLYDFGKKIGGRAERITAAHPVAQRTAVTEAATGEAERQRAAMLQRTPAETAAAMAPAPAMEGGVAVPSPEQLQRTVGFRQAYSGARGRVAGHYGQQYNEFEQRYGSKESPATPVREALDKWKDVLHEQQPVGQPASPIQGLMARAQNLAYRGPAPRGIQDLIPAAELQRMDPQIRESLERKFANKERIIYGGRQGTVVLEPKDYLKGATAKPTFTQLRALRTEANRFAESTPNDRDAKIADDIANATDKSLEEVEGISKPDLAKLRNLNTQWRDFKSTWTSRVGGQVAGTNEPAEAMGKILEDPKLSRQLASTANPDEKLHLRNGLADWANDKKLSLAQIGQKVDPAVLKDLGFNLPPEAWLKLEPKEIELSTIVNSSPFARQQYGAAFDREMDAVEQRQTQALRREGLTLARQLGPAGRQYEAELSRVTSPQDIFAAAGRLAHMTPEEVIQRSKAALQTPASAAFQESLGTEDKARRQFEQTMAQQKPPEQAARESLQKLEPNKFEAWMSRWMKYRALFYGGSILGTMALRGHPSSYAIGMAIMDAAIMGSYSGPRAMSRALLRNPKIADLAWEALKAPKTTSGLRLAGRATAGILAAVAEQQSQEAPPEAPSLSKPRLTFKAGERRTKGGVTYERDEAGRWHKVSS